MTYAPQDLRNISVTPGTGFTVALFVRDRLALPVASDVPALAPGVEARAVPDDEAAALAAEWRAWWERLAEAPTGRVVRPASERLATVFDAVVDEARAWEAGNVRPNLFLSEDDLAPGFVPSPVGDPGVPVVYDVELVPLDGAWHRDIGPHRLLVSTRTWEDPAAMEAILRSRIERLQGQGPRSPHLAPDGRRAGVHGQRPAPRPRELRLPLGERADRGLRVLSRHLDPGTVERGRPAPGDPGFRRGLRGLSGRPGAGADDHRPRRSDVRGLPVASTAHLDLNPG